MIITCNLDGHLVVRPDGVEESALWVGDDGALLEIYESRGRVHRSFLLRHPWDEHKAAIVRRKKDRRKAARPHMVKLTLAIEAAYWAVGEVLGWKDLGVFWEKVKEWQLKVRPSRHVKAAVGGRLFALNRRRGKMAKCEPAPRR